MRASVIAAVAATVLLVAHSPCTAEVRLTGLQEDALHGWAGIIASAAGDFPDVPTDVLDMDGTAASVLSVEKGVEPAATDEGGSPTAMRTYVKVLFDVVVRGEHEARPIIVETGRF